MRSLLSFLVLCALACCGCAGRTTPSGKTQGAQQEGTGPVWASPPATTEALIVTPESTSAGKVVLVDPRIRCVVLNFPVGKMAATEQRLSLYRGGLKVGEVKVTGPQREDNIVADLVAGEAQVGDEVRVQ